jgi:non-homologous end joining protein Ku
MDQNKLKELKVKLEQFQKVAKVDNVKGVEIAKETIIIIDNLLLEVIELENPKVYKDLNLSKDSFNMYIKNIEEMTQISKKWK